MKFIKYNQFNYNNNYNISNYYLISNHYMNHNNINKKYFSISQSYTTSSVRGDGDRILIKSSLKKTKTKSIKCSISEVLVKYWRKGMMRIENQWRILLVLEMMIDLLLRLLVLPHLSKQPLSDTRGSFDKLHKHITVSDLRELNVMIGEEKLTRRI